MKKEKVCSIAQIINRDRSSDRLCTSRGVRTCLKGSSASVKSKRVYKRKLGFAALAFVDAEVNADRDISGRELQQRLQEKLHANVSISLRATTNGLGPDEYTVLSDDTRGEQRKTTLLLH